MPPPSPEKSHPLFLSNPPLKVEVLSAPRPPPLLKIWLEAHLPPPLQKGRGGGRCTLLLANVFMCHFENIWMENCPPHLNYLFTQDSLIHFYSFEQRIVLKSLKIISTNNKYIKFTLEVEGNDSLSFLD